MDQTAMANMMRNPEVMRLISKPGMMEKMQQIMSNPATAQWLMNDPDVQQLMQLVQGGAGGLGGGFGGGAFGGGGAAAGAGNAGAPSGPDAVIKIHSREQFESQLRNAGDKLVVVDWTASWCGPCARIAPAFADAARTNQDKCIFLKVDVDECQALAGEHGVSSMPTFSFFKHQSKVDSFSGADESKLHATIDKHTKEPPSQYLHFPMRFDAMFSFKDIKFDLLLKNLIKFNGDMVNEVADMSAAPLSESELGDITSLCTLLDDKAHYHQSSITAAQFQSLCKLLDWPIKTALPALNIWRVLAFHPGAAKLMADAFDGTLRGKLAALCRKAQGNSNATMLLCRTLCNMFSRRALALSLVQHMGDFMEPLAACTSSTDDNVRKAWACLALNFAVMFLNTQPPAGGSFEEHKVQLVSGALELLNADGNSVETAYRTLQLIGTLVFRDAACQAVADSLDVSSQIDSMIAKFPAEAALQAAGAEVKQHVATGK